MDLASDNAVARPWRKLWFQRLVTALVLLAIGGLAGWSISELVAPRDEVTVQADYVLVAVGDGEVGASLTFNATVGWKTEPVGTNRAHGVVTGVHLDPGSLLAAGDIVYSVNGRPVAVAEGVVPAFRSMSRGDEGSDVRQLQRLLLERGYYRGAIDGAFGPSTARAVRAWQENSGVESTGSVPLGDIIFVPELPVRAVLDETVIRVDATLSGGEAGLLGLPPEPTFEIRTSDEQLARFTVGLPVEIEHEDRLWHAIIAGYQRDQEGVVSVLLEGIGGGAVCGDECASIPVGASTLMPARVITQETLRGPLVPAAALISLDDGSAAVLGEDGDTIPVKILGSARGMAVISGDGVFPGLKVRIPAESPAASS